MLFSPFILVPSPSHNNCRMEGSRPSEPEVSAVIQSSIPVSAPAFRSPVASAQSPAFVPDVKPQNNAPAFAMPQSFKPVFQPLQANPPGQRVVPFQPAGSAPQGYQPLGMAPVFKSVAGLLPANPKESDESAPIVRAQTAPVEEEEKGYLEKTTEVLGIIYEQGKQILKSNALPTPEDDPRKSVRNRLEECSGLKDDYQFWSCPACTLENPTEFYQCEACQQENKVLQALMKAINRPCDKRAKKGWF